MSTWQDLEQIKGASQRTKDIVFGFIRDSQRSFVDFKKEYLIIPELVEYLCLFYYFQREYFSLCGDSMKINETKDVITKASMGQTNNSVYGNIAIDNSIPVICQWIFKIIKCTTDIVIGIDSSNKSHTNDDFSLAQHNSCKFYSFGNNGYTYDDRSDDGVKYPGAFKDNDIVEMHLNVKTRTMEVVINEKDKCIVYDDIDFDSNKQYNLAIYMYGHCDSLQLLTFERVSVK